MRAFVAVTDREWFRFLRGRTDLDEVNFWQPGGGPRFHALARGEPLLFKLHAPENSIVGGGFFAHFSVLPHTVAWDFFGEKNGSPSAAEMRRRIERFRHLPKDPKGSHEIGCILLVSPFFFHERDWIGMPADWSLNIPRGKGYDLGAGPGARLWQEIELRLQGRMDQAAPAQPLLYTEPPLLLPRLGEGTFRALVADAYQRRCAVTREGALPVLEAAHIVPISEGGRHEVPNGLLLRSDLRRLFGRGYLTVTPDHRVRVSRRLGEEFDSGELYQPLEGQEIWVPGRAEERPRNEFLQWHGDAVFLG